MRFVNVTWDIFWGRHRIDFDGWDTHTRNFTILRDWNLPQLDQTLSALLSDLDARGLLDETLILLMSEMGRTPRINANAGRDHWTYCYSVLLAGAGIRGGSVCGAVGRPGGLREGSARQAGGRLRHSLRVPGNRRRPDSDRSGGPAAPRGAGRERPCGRFSRDKIGRVEQRRDDARAKPLASLLRTFLGGVLPQRPVASPQPLASSFSFNFTARVSTQGFRIFCR